MDETGSPDLVGYCLWDIKEFSKIVKQLCELAKSKGRYHHSSYGKKQQYAAIDYHQPQQ